MDFLLRKYYNYLHNIDMVLLWTSYMYGGFLEYYFKLQFSAFWSMHDKTSSSENANFKMYFPKKTELPPEKKLTPGHHLKNLEHPGKNLKSLGISESHEKPQASGKISAPRHQKKENLNLQENEKTFLLVKVSTTHVDIYSCKGLFPYCFNHYEKASNPPLEKFSISQKTLIPSEKFLTPLK